MNGVGKKWMMIAGCLVSLNVSWAGRPLSVDDADPVDKGLFEFEAGGAFSARRRGARVRRWSPPSSFRRRTRTTDWAAARPTTT